jgi:hypothetical protein
MRQRMDDREKQNAALSIAPGWFPEFLPERHFGVYVGYFGE